MAKKIVKPELASGLKDFLPEEMIPRQKMMDTIRNTMELFGFLPLSTPVLEKMDILTGGDKEFNKQIFKIKNSEKLALRFDLTVPLARVFASNTLERPFKRYQFGPVFRGESAQLGRYREFYQFDADIVGSDSLMADAEIIALMYYALSALGVPEFTIKINSRKILNGLASYAGFPDKKTPDVLRIIDKLDKIGLDGVVSELTERGFNKKQISAIKGFVSVKGDGSEGVLLDIAGLMANSAIANEGMNDLRTITNSMVSLGVPRKNWRIDLSIARGLGYYTATVFEVTVNGFESIGTVAAGGRYDGLIEKFSNNPVSAVGASIGVDRLFAALEEKGKAGKKKIIADILILNLDKTCEKEVQKASASLRASGIKTEIYLGREDTFKGQLAYAVSREYPVVVIIGPKELERGVAQVKDMVKRTQSEVKISDTVEIVKSILK